MKDHQSIMSAPRGHVICRADSLERVRRVHSRLICLLSMGGIIASLGCQPAPPPLYDQDRLQYGRPSVGDMSSNQIGSDWRSSGGEESADMGTGDALLSGEEAGGRDDLGAPPLDAAIFDPIPFAVETRVGERFTPAGLENRVTCQLLDQRGEAISAPNLRVEIVPSQGFERTEVGVIGAVAREYQLTCIAPDEGLIDATPALWTVIPTSAQSTVAAVSDSEVEAGAIIEVECEAFDAFGNSVDAPFEQHITSPEADGAQIGGERVGARWRMTRTGRYEARCDVVGIDDVTPATIEVRAGPPRHISLALNPDLPIYRVGQVVELITSVRDRDDNPIRGVEVEVSADPELPSFGYHRYRLNALGRFTLTAALSEQEGMGLEDEEPISASREIFVDFGGPGIRCLSPDRGEFVRLDEGDNVLLSGQLSDVSGVEALFVDGAEVPFDEAGRFQVEVESRWGLNIHDIQAIDVDGESSAFCAYFGAPSYLEEGVALQDALSLFLGQDVVDDGPPESPLRSIGDVLRRVVNSPGLRDQVHQTALAQNPIVPSECRARVLGVCLFRLGVDYTDFGVSRQNELSFTLLEEGLRVRVVLRDLSVQARLRGTLGNRVRVSTSGITVDLTFNMRLGLGGRPDINLRSINEVTVNRLDSDISGFIVGSLLELVFRAFEGLIRDEVTNTIRGFLETELDRALTGLFSDIEVGELGTGVTIDTPSGEALTLQLLAALSRFEITPAGILIGLASRFDGPDRIGGVATEVPLLPEPPPPFPNQDAVGASIKLTLINQALSQLWRGGYFTFGAEEGSARFGANLPEGAGVSLSSPYPPFVEGLPRPEGEVGLSLSVGPLSAAITYPGFFEEPFALQLVARLNVTVALIGERDLSFGQVEVDELYLSLGSSVPLEARQRLESVLREVLQGVMDDALNDALPTLPLPELSIPTGLENLDLPSTLRLGLRSPTLIGDRALWRVGGSFGE
jgi:hypothetical protein